MLTVSAHFTNEYCKYEVKCLHDEIENTTFLPDIFLFGASCVFTLKYDIKNVSFCNSAVTFLKIKNFKFVNIDIFDELESMIRD